MSGVAFCKKFKSCSAFGKKCAQHDNCLKTVMLGFCLLQINKRSSKIN